MEFKYFQNFETNWSCWLQDLMVHVFFEFYSCFEFEVGKQSTNSWLLKVLLTRIFENFFFLFCFLKFLCSWLCQPLSNSIPACRLQNSSWPRIDHVSVPLGKPLDLPFADVMFLGITRYDTGCDIRQCVIDEHTTCLQTFIYHICYVPNKVSARS